MIRVFHAADTVFTSNGDIVLNPLKAVVHNEDNGNFYLELEADLKYADWLTGGNIIIAPTPGGDQPFRISKPQKTRRKISLKAYHIFYDADNYLIADSYVVNKNCNDALAHLNAATDATSPFTTLSNVATVDSYRCVRKSLNEAVKTVLERWGGHLVRDGWNIKILSTIGHDNGVIVRYAKNLKDITFTESWESVVTKLLPTGTDGIMLNALDPGVDPYLYASVSYDIPYTKTVAFEQSIKQEDYASEAAYKAALIADLRVQAQAYIDKYCVPEINYTINAYVENVTDLGDTINVIDERLGIDILTSVIAYDFNCISKRFLSLQFGNYRQKRLNNLIDNIVSDAQKKTEIYTNNAVAAVQSDVISANSKVNALYAAAGDAVTVSGCPLPGMITDSGTKARFMIPSPKNMHIISGITVSALTGAIRGIDGLVNSYTDTHDWTDDADITISATKTCNNLIMLEIASATAFANATNDTPCTLYAATLTYTFS